MAVTDEFELEGFEPADLDGHTIDELSDYLDSDRTPFDVAIESSPGCQIAMAAMVRLRAVSLSLLDAEASEEAPRDDSWVAGILNRIGFEAQAGRSIPVTHPSARASLSLTEGAVRGLIRAAGDAVTGVLIGRCTLQGDVSVPGEPITVQVDASIFWGESMQDAAARVREAIYADLLKHTELHIVSIDVTIHDVHLSRSIADDSAEQHDSAGRDDSAEQIE